MKKHHHPNKYDKQRKYYDNSKQNQPKENLAPVSVPILLNLLKIALLQHSYRKRNF